jgi:RNA polymerase sigma-70 factor (ECF subfamily)
MDPPASPDHLSMKRGAPGAPEPEDGFAEIYARTFGLVWGILGRAGIRRTAERHELAQEVYLVVAMKRAARDRSVTETAWVGTIAWNFARRYRQLARTRREQPMDDPEALEEPIVEGSSPEEIVGLRRRYLDVMEGLSFDRRVVFEMHDVDGFTLEEIAKALGLKEGTVTTRLRLAREDVAAATTRMAAREAHAEGRTATAPLLVPFGAGAWASMGKLFDDAPAGVEARLWRDVCRAVARSAALGAAAGAAAIATGKATAAALVGSGFAFGGAAVGGALYLLRLLAQAPADPPSIARAPEVTASTAAATTTASAESVTSAGAAPRLPVLVAPVATGATGAPVAPVVPLTSGIDPEEERIIARAQAAYVRGNTDAARAALREHALRFPGGRAKLDVESRDLAAKLDGHLDAGAPARLATPDGGRAPHRLLGSDDD